MAIQIQGNSGTVAEVDGTQFRAQRYARRPIDYNALGIYSISGQTGTIAAGLAANSEVFQFRWTDPTRLCAIYRVDCNGAGGITAFTAGFVQMSVTVARSWTVAGTGGSVLTTTGNNQKLRSSMGTSLVGEIRVATTVALTAGTKTLDAQPLGSATGSTTATAGEKLLQQEHLFGAAEMADNMPIILSQNEGIVIRATVPATGTWITSFDITWAELDSY
jgi:hypothetical protein